ncbi:hypothetical protein [Amycolatopsis sp. lyj-112]|uniref:hypothetical protein n=1 Tax=Amycolatopsis sp. lyj-112 TaxID=2789288 RepID=UPI003979A1C9
MRRTSLRAIGALTAAFTLAGLATAVPANAAVGPDLKVTVTLPEGPWLQNENVPLDLTITNVGDTKAEAVKGVLTMTSGPSFYVRPDQWGDLDAQGAGATFDPGQTRMYRLLGSVGDLGNDSIFELRVRGSADANEADNTSEVRVDVVQQGTTDRVGGHLYGDADHNGLPSPGESLAGVPIRLYTGPGELTTTTDSTGHFTFETVPAGVRWLNIGDFPGGWVKPTSPNLRLDGSGKYTAVELKATRPLTEALTASATLDKKSYAAGETAKATVVLTNTSDRRLTGLWAGCDPAGTEQHLKVPNTQWGDFSPLKQAGVLEPGQRLEIQVSGKVPTEASYFGRTGLTCYTADMDATSGPVLSASGTVPGKRADSRGRLWTDKNGNRQWDSGEQVPNTTVTLGTESGKFVALARTDANGSLTFPNVGVGVYRLQVAGPWQPVGDNGDTTVYVVAPPYGLGDWYQQVAPR